MQVRTPAVAGMFYPKSQVELRSTIRDCFLHRYGPGKLPPSLGNEKIVGVICPHAGYMYSGPIAANSYYAISAQQPDLVENSPWRCRGRYGCGCGNKQGFKDG